MNLKKAFRYQNVYAEILKQALVQLTSNSNYLEGKEIHQKSKLNLVSLNKGFEDETMPLQESIVIQGLCIYPRDNSLTKYYNPQVVLNIYNDILKEKIKLSQAVSEAKKNIVVQGYSYDTAIYLANFYRKSLSEQGAIESLNDSSKEVAGYEYVITNPELNPSKLTYPIKIEIKVDVKSKDEVLKYFQDIRNNIEELSDEIEANVLKTNVKYEAPFSATETFKSLYEKYSTETNTSL